MRECVRRIEHYLLYAPAPCGVASMPKPPAALRLEPIFDLPYSSVLYLHAPGRQWTRADVAGVRGVAFCSGKKVWEHDTASCRGAHTMQGGDAKTERKTPNSRIRSDSWHDYVHVVGTYVAMARHERRSAFVYIRIHYLHSYSVFHIIMNIAWRWQRSWFVESSDAA